MSQRWRGRAFVGREAELAAVRSAVDGARDGVPAVLLVGGEAGIGKWTLVVQAQPEPASLTCWAAASPSGASRPPRPAGRLAAPDPAAWPRRRCWSAASTRRSGGASGPSTPCRSAEVNPRDWLHASRVPGVVRSHQGRSDEVVELCRGALGVAEAADDHCAAPGITAGRW